MIKPGLYRENNLPKIKTKVMKMRFYKKKLIFQAKAEMHVVIIKL